MAARELIQQLALAYFEATGRAPPRNARTLCKAWGKNTDDWNGKRVRASAGELPYEGSTKRGVVLEPISPSLTPAERTEPAPEPEANKPPTPEVDDEILF